MMKILFALVISAALVPAAFAAAPAQTPSAFCKAPASALLIGTGNTYKNFGACVAKQQTQQESNTTNANTTCKMEMALAPDAFKALHVSTPAKTFDEWYGTGNSKGKGNAFGKCVSQHASAKTAEQQAAQVAAGKKCATALLKASIGTNKLYRNRGACVAAQSKPAS